MTAFAVEVIYVDGRRTWHEFDDHQQVTVGSDRDAALPIAGVRELAGKHLLLVPREGGCWVSAARGVEPRVTCNGKPVDNLEVSWGTELDIGSITLRVAEPEAKSKARDNATKSLIRIGAVALLAVGAIWFMKRAPAQTPTPPANAPVLFSDDPRPCQVPDDEAFQRATELQTASREFMQRFAFDAREGVRAVHAIEEAHSCFVVAKQISAADAALQNRGALVEKIDAAYRALRLELRLSLKSKDHPQTLKTVARLGRLLQHQPSNYTKWLVRVARYAQEKSKKSKKK